MVSNYVRLIELDEYRCDAGVLTGEVDGGRQDSDGSNWAADHRSWASMGTVVH